MVFDLWSLVFGPRSLVTGLWSLVFCILHLVFGRVGDHIVLKVIYHSRNAPTRPDYVKVLAPTHFERFWHLHPSREVVALIMKNVQQIDRLQDFCVQIVEPSLHALFSEWSQAASAVAMLLQEHLFPVQLVDIALHVLFVLGLDENPPVQLVASSTKR